MKGRYPLRPFAIPAAVGIATGVGLVAALLYDGAVEAFAVGLVALVVVIVISCLVSGRRRRGALRPNRPPD